jgi:mycofactocin precursor
MPDPQVIDRLPAPAVPPVAAEAPPEPDDLVEDELLVEDVSIDGMCGVY